VPAVAADPTAAPTAPAPAPASTCRLLTKLDIAPSPLGCGL